MLATVNSPIREGRSGEIIYSHGRARKAATARSEDGKAIERGEEVVVIRYEKGLADTMRQGVAPETSMQSSSSSSAIKTVFCVLQSR